MLTYGAGEVEEREVLHPIVVVYQFCVVGSIRLEVEEFAQLLFDTLLVVAQGLFVEQVALLRFARGVANHTGSTPDQGQRFVAAALEMSQHHHAAQVAYVERIGRGVETQVGGNHFLFKEFFCTRHHGVYHSAPF